MIDIHCHLIPNVDDGPDSWEESLEMARIACRDGIRYAFATPHWVQGSGMAPSPELVCEGVERLNELVSQGGLNYKVYPGMEIGLCENLPRLVETGEVLLLGESDCLLVETPFVSLPWGMGEILFGLISMGIRPVLAHPERNRVIQREPEIVADFVEKGTLIQVNAFSLCGDYGEGARRCCTKLAEMGLIHTLASDGHSAQWRPPIISEGLKELECLVGEKRVGELLESSIGIFLSKRIASF